MQKVKFIDLFSGMGGMRIGFEQACSSLGVEAECLFSSEIKKHAVRVLEHNFSEKPFGDVSLIADIEDFDFLLAGFPCQAFSSAGNRDGFCDTRGTLFFEIERILKAKKPKGFLLENVEGLVTHDGGNTLKTILQTLKSIGYFVSYGILDSVDFGLPQSRKRIYIVGTLVDTVEFVNFPVYEKKVFSDIMEKNKEVVDSEFTRKLLSNYSLSELEGKSIKDKRGGSNNIHSWDFDLKGIISLEQKELLNKLFKERRKKHWSKEIGIDWMDGIPLTVSQIRTFYDSKNLEKMLFDLVNKGYLVYEHPKKLVKIRKENGSFVKRREYDETKEKGFNIVTGKLSFEFSTILKSNGTTPTMVASDMEKIGVIDNVGIRKLTIKEGLRLFGYPETYDLSILQNERKAFDLLGNTVAVPVVKEVSSKVLKTILNK